MTRLLAAMKTDVVLQARNQLYGISIGVALVSAAALAWLSPLDLVAGTFPMALLMFVGGSTLLYVVAMIILEKDDGTLAAIAVSPLRPREYLAAKVVTLSALATLEGVLIVAGAWLILRRNGDLPLPSAWTLVGLVALAVMHVLVGIVLVVRYQRITEAMLPMGAVATVLQLPALYFVGAIDHPALLAIPSAAPTLLIRAGFAPLATWEWVYALAGSAVTIALLALWSARAFETHVLARIACRPSSSRGVWPRTTCASSCATGC